MKGGYIRNISISPSGTEQQLIRVANALEKLVAQQEPSNDVLDFLASVDGAELEAETIKRKNMATPLMQTALDILREWAAIAGA